MKKTWLTHSARSGSRGCTCSERIVQLFFFVLLLIDFVMQRYQSFDWNSLCMHCKFWGQMECTIFWLHNVLLMPIYQKKNKKNLINFASKRHSLLRWISVYQLHSCYKILELVPNICYVHIIYDPRYWCLISLNFV